MGGFAKGMLSLAKGMDCQLHDEAAYNAAFEIPKVYERTNEAHFRNRVVRRAAAVLSVQHGLLL